MNVRNRVVMALVLFLCAVDILAQERPVLSKVDRTRLAEAFRLGENLGDRVWKDWSKTPFAVLLVTPESEFLIRHPRPSDDFKIIGYDPLLKSDVYFRKRVFEINLLATFPAVSGVSTIVIGQAENTNKKTSTPWVITVLHEHFHQLQDSQPNFNAETGALNLSRGDNSGMWMLNYPFPYESNEVSQQFSVLGRLLVEALETSNESAFSSKLELYLEARRALQKILNPDDYTYLSFQLWKEGLARYTEYRVASLAGTKYRPSKEFRALKDFTSFDSVAKKIKSSTMNELSNMRLADFRRVAFYSLGAGEGLLLDRVNPNWQNRYFADKFYPDKYFTTVR